MTGAAGGALTGLVAGLGLLALASWGLARRPRRLVLRIAPYVATLTPGRQAATTAGPWAALLEMTRPATPQAGAGRDARLRLQRAGLTVSPERYVLERLTWAAVGACAGAAAGSAAAFGGSTPSGIVLLGVFGALAGWLLRDALLREQTRRRQREIERQLPVLAELLALAVASGAGPAVALDRAAGTMTGALPQEVALAADGVRSGLPLDRCLVAMAERTGVASVRRFVDGIVIAVARGTPLADVVRAQAADARANERRLLMEAAGRKDVAMLVPIVFLILPIVILVALFPGVQALQLVVP